jgi:hypothetical protein
MNVVTSPAIPRPAYASKDGQRLISVYVSRLEPSPTNVGLEMFPAGREPNSAERAKLMKRAGDIKAGLQPNPVACTMAITAMRMFFRTYGESEAEAEVQVAVWVSRLRWAPTWAVEITVERFAEGTVEGKWCHQRGPTTAEFAPVVAGIIAPFQAELDRIQRILDAEIVGRPHVSEAERGEVVAKGLKAFRDTIEPSIFFDAVEA